MDRTFLLGLGCMKGGTTWLHDYLSASPQCEPGFRKEYHVFDSRDAEREPWLLSRVLAKAHTSLDELAADRSADGGATVPSTRATCCRRRWSPTSRSTTTTSPACSPATPGCG